MASSSSSSSMHLFFFFSILFLCNFQIHALVFPVTRDLPTGQYLAQIRLGDSLNHVNLVIDLAGSLLWFDCSHGSSSRSLISGGSSGCLKARAGEERISRGDKNDAFCDLLLKNGVVGISARGELAKDGFSSVGSSSKTVDLFFACAPQWLLRGLASGAQGVMGLGKAQISLPSQLAAETSERRRLTVYLSSLNGVVSTNSVEEVFGVAASRSLVYTPLTTDSNGNYVIKVKSIKVNGEKLSINGPLTTELSSIVPYTIMESSIYKVFIEAYTKSASNATIVPSIAPFSLCFANTTPFEEDFPSVDLALQSEMVKWRIQRRNLMVDLGNGIRCLGIVDGGLNRVNRIVMGGLQLEGFILDFDLGNSMMGFVERRSSDLRIEAL